MHLVDMGVAADAHTTSVGGAPITCSEVCSKTRSWRSDTTSGPLGARHVLGAVACARSPRLNIVPCSPAPATACFEQRAVEELTATMLREAVEVRPTSRVCRTGLERKFDHQAAVKATRRADMMLSPYCGATRRDKCKGKRVG